MEPNVGTRRGSSSTSKVERSGGSGSMVSTRPGARLRDFLALRLGSDLADPFAELALAPLLEDRLSDALHTGLMQRFIDRRTTHLIKRLRVQGPGGITALARTAYGTFGCSQHEQALPSELPGGQLPLL